jgi:hypothetical protein
MVVNGNFVVIGERPVWFSTGWMEDGCLLSAKMFLDVYRPRVGYDVATFD